MIVPAQGPQRQWHRCAARAASVGVRALGLFVGLAPSCYGTQALAEVGGSIAVTSDDWFRGRSVSSGHPVVTLDVSYDDVSGVYLGGAVDAAIAPDSPDLLSLRANLGYAWRLRSGVTLDAGLARSNYTRDYGGGSAAHYTEIYLGIVTDHVSAHVHYSPDYFRGGVSTLYAEVDATMQPATNWWLTGHAGALVHVAGADSDDESGVGYDWRLGIGKRIGAFDLQLAWSASGRTNDYYDRRGYGRSAVTASASYAF